MKGEVKSLAVVWGCWLVCGVKTAPHRYDRDVDDTIFLILFGSFTLFALGMSGRFVYRLATIRSRISDPPASGRDETSSAST
ncbi:hypothetical protein [Streptomyces sp. NPDC046332]|uniref:hypothetical protein n=1 Tax=Streptomyces sp. NPDC046332 TaxID=3155133 RepID=UPI0033CEA00B